MAIFASVMTAKGAAAISSIQLTGDSAGQIIKKIFKPTAGKEPTFRPGDILIGDIFDDGQIVDHVVIGCESFGNFAINCHGNALIVEMIMNLLKKNGAELVSAEQLLANQFEKEASLNIIAKEAMLAQLKAVTIEGVKIIANQPKTGLAKTADNWLKDIDSAGIEHIGEQCRQILARSQTAGLIINGAKVVITGPPNSGKSTLLNCLAGREKAIVTHIAGTTRDWITATCRADSLLMELFDTAGLDQNLRGKNDINKESQKRATELLADCDLVLLVLDQSKLLEKWNVEFKKDKKILVVFNKSDLSGKIDENRLDFGFQASVRISAKFGTNIDTLIEKIREVLGIAEFDLTAAVCFTDRQQRLLGQLLTAKTKPKAKSIITQLLNAEMDV